MTLFKRSHSSRMPTPVVATNASLESWCHQSLTQPPRFVRKVELCTALTTGVDAWRTPVSGIHYHTLLRVSLVPTRSGPDDSVDTLLIERVLSIRGAFHSVTPVLDMFRTRGTISHPDVHDRVCSISDGPSTLLAHDLTVERTIKYGDWASEPRLTLAEFAQILAFVSRLTKRVCDDADCRFQSRSFAFTCLAALAPTLPPRVSGEGVDTTFECEAEMVDDAVFELTAEAVLGQAPWTVRDPASMEALDMIGSLKDEPRETASARLYH